MMTFLLALLAGIIGCVLGSIAGTVIASFLAPVLGISSFEGEAGYFAVFMGGGLGGIVGLIAGAVWMLRRRGVTGFGALAGYTGAVFVGFFVVDAAVFGLIYLASIAFQDRVNPNGLAPRLVFELRLPPGPAPAKGTEATLSTSKNRMPALMQPEKMRAEEGRTILVGSVEMYYRTSSRLLAVTLPDRAVFFDIKLPGAPKHSRDLSDWQRATTISEPGQETLRRATANDNYEIRYRADWPGEE